MFEVCKVYHSLIFFHIRNLSIKDLILINIYIYYEWICFIIISKLYMYYYNLMQCYDGQNEEFGIQIYFKPFWIDLTNIAQRHFSQWHFYVYDSIHKILEYINVKNIAHIFDDDKTLSSFVAKILFWKHFDFFYSCGKNATCIICFFCYLLRVCNTGLERCATYALFFL